MVVLLAIGIAVGWKLRQWQGGKAAVAARHEVLQITRRHRAPAAGRPGGGGAARRRRAAAHRVTARFADYEYTESS